MVDEVVRVVVRLAVERRRAVAVHEQLRHPHHARRQVNPRRGSARAPARHILLGDFVHHPPAEDRALRLKDDDLGVNPDEEGEADSQQEESEDEEGDE